MTEIVIPEISFVATDPAQIEADIIASYETASGRTLAPADPVRLLVAVFAAREVQLRYVLDFDAKQNLLRYSTGAYLDEVVELVGVTRLPASLASTTLRFTLSAEQPNTVTIPAGTRATNGTVTFATLADAQVAAGDTTIDVPAAAVVAGTAANGYVAGQVNQMVDPLPWLQAVSNIDTSQGGAEIETDAALRERYRDALASYSVAGPVGAYVYWAKTASPSILDVSVTSPTPGAVLITPLLADGEVPEQALLDAVARECADTTRRPLTDQVTVSAPEVVPYDITLTYYLHRNDDNAQETAIRVAIAQAVTDFQSWQRARLGRDINPSELIRRVMDSGAKRVTVAAPTYTALTDTQVAQAGTVTLTDGGSEYE